MYIYTFGVTLGIKALWFKIKDHTYLQTLLCPPPCPQWVQPPSDAVLEAQRLVSCCDVCFPPRSELRLDYSTPSNILPVLDELLLPSETRQEHVLVFPDLRKVTRPEKKIYICVL